jgi:hypothetical protein
MRPRTAWSTSAAWSVIAVLLLAAVLRFWQLGSMPILYFDSGAYLGEGRFLASAAQRAADAMFQPTPGSPPNPMTRVVQAVQDGTAGHPPDLAKPGQAVLLALAMLLLGPTTLAAGMVPALAGLGTVAATLGIGSTGWRRRVGIAAAVLLGISAEHLVYSREPLVESSGLFFATLAGFFYLRRLVQPERFGGYGALLLVGLAIGAAFACNNRLLYLPLLFGAFEIGTLWRDAAAGRLHSMDRTRLHSMDRTVDRTAGGSRSNDGAAGVWLAIAWRLCVLGVGVVLPLAVLEGAFLAAQAISLASGAAPGFLDYAHQFVNFMRMNPASRARLDQWPTFFADLGLMDGLPLLALLVLGAVALAVRARRRWSRADVFLATSFWVPVVLFSVYSSGEVRMRNFSVVLPWAMLLAALGLNWAAERTRYPSQVVAAVLCVLGLYALPRDVEVITAPSATPALLETLAERDIQRVASTDGAVLSYYVGEERTNARLRPAFINTEEDVRQTAVDYPYVVVDMQGYWTPGPVTEHAARAAPVFEAPNGNGILFLAFLLERHGVAWGDWDAIVDELNANRGSATQLRLYRSSDLAAS